MKIPRTNHHTCVSRCTHTALVLLGASVALAALVVSASMPESAGRNQVFAQRLESPNFMIDFGNFNMTAGEKSSTNFRVTDTVGQTGAGPYGQWGTSNYFLGGGFQYIYQVPEFSFTISSLAIDLGLLIPGTHSSQSQTLSITTRGSGGYAVYTLAEHALRHQDGQADIPHTTCNTGCTYATAGIWTTPSIAGFGYNMVGATVPSTAGEFVDNTYFKAFPDRSLSQDMQAVMSSDTVGIEDEATVTYKAGASGNQAAGRYSTVIQYIAVPGY